VVREKRLIVDSHVPISANVTIDTDIRRRTDSHQPGIVIFPNCSAAYSKARPLGRPFRQSHLSVQIR
jgi:hypothetical protein